VIDFGITQKQQEMIEFIVEYYRMTLFYPSYEEIREKIGLKSKSSVQEHMDKLEAQGVVMRKKGSKQWRLANMNLLLKGVWGDGREKR
jgi:SOS-response transcriptional repressor LexA